MRKQFHLRHLAAKTIHRSQADTLDQVVVEFNTSRKDALHTLCWSKQCQVFFILNFCEQKIHTSDTVKNELTQRRTNRKLNFTLQFPDKVNSTCTKHCISKYRIITYKHIEHVKH